MRQYKEKSVVNNSVGNMGHDHNGDRGIANTDRVKNMSLKAPEVGVEGSSVEWEPQTN